MTKKPLKKTPERKHVLKSISEGTENSSFDPAQVVGFRDLIATFNINAVALQRIIDGGYIQKNKEGMYKLCDAVQGHARFIRDHGQKKSGTTRDVAAIKVQEARAAQIEQETALQAKDLISYTEHCAIHDLLYGSLRAELDGMPARLTRERETRTKYAGEFDGLLQRLQNKWERLSKGETLDEEVVDA